jgi:hypothetical protein
MKISEKSTVSHLLGINALFFLDYFNDCLHRGRLSMFASERETSDRLVAVPVAGVRVRLSGGLSRLLGGDTRAPPNTSGQPGERQRPCSVPHAGKLSRNLGEDAVIFYTPFSPHFNL